MREGKSKVGVSFPLCRCVDVFLSLSLSLLSLSLSLCVIISLSLFECLSLSLFTTLFCAWRAYTLSVLTVIVRFIVCDCDYVFLCVRVFVGDGVVRVCKSLCVCICVGVQFICGPVCECVCACMTACVCV